MVADLDQLADGLDSSARRLSSLLAADRELAVDASHQLRTPLTALSMRLEEMIAAADDPDVVREEGNAALTQAERLADVVTQLLSPARRATAASAALTGIDEIVQQQVVEWEPAFRRARRKLEVIGVRDLQAHVTPGGLAQVLATLLDNALMHGGGTVTLQTSQSARSVVIEVRDEGDGIPPELVSRIFERSVSGRPEGTGLGLALARTMAAADGGRVVLVKPKPATFAVFLPRHPPRPGTPRPRPRLSRRSPPLVPALRFVWGSGAIAETQTFLIGTCPSPPSFVGTHQPTTIADRVNPESATRAGAGRRRRLR